VTDWFGGPSDDDGVVGNPVAFELSLGELLEGHDIRVVGIRKVMPQVVLAVVIRIIHVPGDVV
jgi:hypothetical protein